MDSLIMCENLDIKPIHTEINYKSPNFLVNPTNGALKIVKSDIEFKKKKYETLSEKSNNLTEIVKKSIENIYTPLNKTKNEIQKLLSQFEDLMKNLSIPLLSYEKIFNHNTNFRNLNENEDDED